MKSGICVFVCVCLCVREKKINSFEITVIIFKAYNKCKSAELTKTSFFYYFRDRPKNEEGNKGDVGSIGARVTKHVSKMVAKAEVNLN